MISKNLKNIIKKILKISEENNLNLMLMGGIAVSVWGNPRATYDIDVIIQCEKKDIDKLLKIFENNCFEIEKERPLKSIKNLYFVTLFYPKKRKKFIIDIFLTEGEYFKEAISRKIFIKVFDIKIPVISPEDLIIYKLISRRERDLEDIRDILVIQKNKLDINYIRKWAEKLGVITFFEDELKSTFCNKKLSP